MLVPWKFPPQRLFGHFSLASRSEYTSEGQSVKRYDFGQQLTIWTPGINDWVVSGGVNFLLHGFMCRQSFFELGSDPLGGSPETVPVLPQSKRRDYQKAVEIIASRTFTYRLPLHLIQTTQPVLLTGYHEAFFEGWRLLRFVQCVAGYNRVKMARSFLQFPGELPLTSLLKRRP